MIESNQEENRNKAIQREIRVGREFTLADAIGKEGGDFLKGESPVPRVVQVITELNLFIAQNLADSSGALQAILQRRIKDDHTITLYLNCPLKALQVQLECLINHPPLLYELVQQVDCQWGMMYGERPFFQQPGQSPHPDDEYTHQSVKNQLIQLLEKVNATF